MKFCLKSGTNCVIPSNFYSRKNSRSRGSFFLTHPISLSGHYLIRQQAPVVFSLYLVYLSTAACISEKIKLGPCWRKDF